MPGLLVEALGGKADLLLSDMAPNTTGHAATDHLRIMALAELAAAFAREVLAKDGRIRREGFPGGIGTGDAGGVEAGIRQRAAREASGEPQGIRASCTWWRWDFEANRPNSLRGAGSSHVHLAHMSGPAESRTRDGPRAWHDRRNEMFF